VDFKSLKEHLFYYTLEQKENNITLRIEGDGKDLAVRNEPMLNGDIRLFTLNQWWYPEMAWQNYRGEFKPAPGKEYTIAIRFGEGKQTH
jgi:hypothetical protein